MLVEVVLGTVTLLALAVHGYLSAVRANNINESLRLEGEQMKINLDHVANAVIGLSELLDDADGVIESVSKIPTTGEVLMDMIRTMIMSKMAPQIGPFADNANLISGLLSPEQHGSPPEIESETQAPQ